ncbi:Gll4423 protein [hydrothermal vent metagenome]|uniref:Gll4423 protein n=1 Tax=hydrothermal vent metagenome TaxID=652676 RepID=A0A3B0RWK0_9ZZZZ
MKCRPKFYLIPVCSLFALITLAASGTAQTSLGASQSDPNVSASVIKAHMAFLADDSLEGREAGTRGEVIAAQYIATQFETLGLLQAGAKQSFFQTVPLRSARLDTSDFEFTVKSPFGDKSFKNGDEIVVFANLQKETISNEAGVIFAGHGIVAPELGIDDYKGLDAKGKIVAVLGGPPSFLPAAEAAHFGSTAQQRLTAAKHGAIGVIVIWTPILENSFPFDRLRSQFSSASLTWVGPDGKANIAAPEIQVRAFVRGNAAQALFQGAEQTAAQVIVAGEAGPVQGFALRTSLKLSLLTEHNDGQHSRNVAALLKGSDPVLADEIIVLTAHYDHVGICAPKEEDKICNGALDNALGVALMLDVARMLSAQQQTPARSILFLAVGAEEKGLLGSDYFAAFPTVPIKSIIANINLDGGLPYYEFSDVIAFGAEQSQMGDRLASAVAKIGLSVAPDPFPELGIFTRSDQYSFVKRGIPALFLYNGFHDQNGDNLGQELWNTAFAKHYHRPSDDLSLPINYQVTAKYADVFRLVTLEVANARLRPLWYGNSVFKKQFAPEAPLANRD